MDVSSPPPADPQVMDLTGDDQDQPLPHIRYKSYRYEVANDANIKHVA